MRTSLSLLYDLLCQRASRLQQIQYHVDTCCTLSVSSEDPTALARVHRFFPPATTQQAHVEAAFCISQLCDEEALDLLEQEITRCQVEWHREIFPGEYATTYSIGAVSSPIRLYRVSTITDVRYWILQQQATEYQEQLLLLVAPTYRDGPHVLLRIARELFYRAQERQGAMFFHGGALVHQGKGLLLVGPHGSGKTTLACHLLSQQVTAAYLGNDHSWVQLQGQQRRVGGFPLVLRLGSGTLTTYPTLQEGLPVPEAAQGKWEAMPDHFAQRLGCGWEGTATLHAIVFPTIASTGPQVPVVEEITPLEGKQLLINECYTPCDPRWKPWLLSRAIDDALLARLVNHRLGHLVQMLPLLRIRFGYTSTQDDIVYTIRAALGRETR